MNPEPINTDLLIKMGCITPPKPVKLPAIAGNKKAMAYLTQGLTVRGLPRKRPIPERMKAFL